MLWKEKSKMILLPWNERLIRIARKNENDYEIYRRNFCEWRNPKNIEGSYSTRWNWKIKSRAPSKKKNEDERRRKELWNLAILKKGLVRAFCRIRPSASQLIKGVEHPATEEEKEKSILKIEQGSGSDVGYLLDPRGYSSSNYLFDRVFGPESKQ
jgi:hypothetical protein